jgi:hypothetical protein
MGKPHGAAERLPGTLDLLILKALVLERMQEYGIAEHLRQPLAVERQEFDRVVVAIRKVLNAT